MPFDERTREFKSSIIMKPRTGVSPDLPLNSISIFLSTSIRRSSRNFFSDDSLVSSINSCVTPVGKITQIELITYQRILITIQLYQATTAKFSIHPLKITQEKKHPTPQYIDPIIAQDLFAIRSADKSPSRRRRRKKPDQS